MDDAVIGVDVRLRDEPAVHAAGEALGTLLGGSDFDLARGGFGVDGDLGTLEGHDQGVVGDWRFDVEL